jgi:hypothetical protein
MIAVSQSETESELSAIVRTTQRYLGDGTDASIEAMHGHGLDDPGRAVFAGPSLPVPAAQVTGDLFLER